MGMCAQAYLRKLLLLAIPKGAFRAVVGTPDDAARVGHKDRLHGHARLMRQQRCGAEIRRASAVEQIHAPAKLFCNGGTRACSDLDCTAQPRHSDRGGSLDVVIVREELVAIGLEERERVVRVEVLEL